MCYMKIKNSKSHVILVFGFFIFQVELVMDICYKFFDKFLICSFFKFVWGELLNPKYSPGKSETVMEN